VTTPGGNFIRARHINGTLPTDERAKALRWLGAAQQQQVRVITNARCLQEGLDVPAVDGVMFADVRNSITDIIQTIGRVLRPAPGKNLRLSCSSPSPCPPTATTTPNLALSAFAQVWAVLRRPTRARLPGWATTSDRAVRTVVNGRMYAARGSERVQFVLPDGVDEAALQLRLVQEVGSAWRSSTSPCRTGRTTTRASGSPANTSHRGIGIGEWAFKQRLARSHGRLSTDRAARLERIPAVLGP